MSTVSEEIVIERLKYGSMVLTLQVVLLPACLSALTTLFSWVRVPLDLVYFLFSIVMTVYISFLSMRKNKHFVPPAAWKKKDFFRITVVFMALVLAGFLVSMWVNGFSSGVEVYKPRGMLFNFLYLAAAMLITFQFLFHFGNVPFKAKIILAILTGLNPVALYRLLGMGGDSQMASLMTVAMIAAFQYTMFREKKVVTVLSIVLLTLCNLKAVGLVYGPAIVVLSWLAVFIIDRDLQKRFVVYMGAALFLAVGVIGFKPYITNIITKGDLFYPALVTETRDTAKLPVPEEFIHKDRFSKFFVSLFAKSESDPERMPVIKRPFSIDGSEIEAFDDGEVTYGGFGPFFGTVLLIMVLASVLMFKTKRLILLYTLIGAAMILITSLLNPQAWWARSAPQLWLLPITFIVSFFYIHKGEYMAYVRGFLISMLLLNVLIVLNKYIG